MAHPLQDENNEKSYHVGNIVSVRFFFNLLHISFFFEMFENNVDPIANFRHRFHQREGTSA